MFDTDMVQKLNEKLTKEVDFIKIYNYIAKEVAKQPFQAQFFFANHQSIKEKITSSTQRLVVPASVLDYPVNIIKRSKKTSNGVLYLLFPGEN